MANCCYTEEEYDQLIQICDKLLRHPDATLELIAIPWLHIINEVPFVLSNYADIIDALKQANHKRRPLHFLRGILKRGHKNAYQFALLMRNLLRPVVDTHGGHLKMALPALKNGRVDVIIVSWLININHLADDEDFYFGGLQEMLAAQGFSSLLVLRNQSGHPTNTLLNQAIRCQPFQRFMLPDHVTVSKELNFLQRCFRMRQKIRKAIIGISTLPERKLLQTVGQLIISNEVIQNLRLHAQIEELCRKTLPSVVITLYEGHSWERCVYHAARWATPNSLCVGYQHTAFRKRSHAVKRSLSPHHDFDPDLVLTVGEVTQQILEKSNTLNGVQTCVFGTHRRTGRDALVHTPRREPTFLVLPEGDEFECIYLFELAIKCSQRMPDAHFILRTHPYFPIERLEARQKWCYPIMKNIEVSRNTKIEDDFNRAGYILYRGSSTVIYAILYGLKPFYFARPNELNFDPLFELSEWRQDVFSVDDLNDKYQADRNTKEGSRTQEWQKARAYCDKYVQHIREDTINQMIAFSKTARN